MIANAASASTESTTGDEITTGIETRTAHQAPLIGDMLPSLAAPGDSLRYLTSSVGVIDSMSLVWLYGIYGRRQQLTIETPPRRIWSGSPKLWISCSRRSGICGGNGIAFVPHSSMRASLSGQNRLPAMPTGLRPSPEGSAPNQCVSTVRSGDRLTSGREASSPNDLVFTLRALPDWNSQAPDWP